MMSHRAPSSRSAQQDGGVLIPDRCLCDVHVFWAGHVRQYSMGSQVPSREPLGSTCGRVNSVATPTASPMMSYVTGVTSLSTAPNMLVMYA